MDRPDAIDHGADNLVGAVSRKDPIVISAKDEIGTRTNPLVIWHDHVVPRGKEIFISCPFPLKIGNARLSFERYTPVKAPCDYEPSARSVDTMHERFTRGSGSLLFQGCIQVKAPQDDELNLYPVNTLHEGFARGWNSLPEELRALVLEFALVRCQPWRDSQAVMPYLRTTPQIAALAKKIFYTENTFRVDRIVPDRGESVKFRGPPLTLRYLMRKVEAVICIRERHDWDFLQYLADGCLGFENLRYLSVRMYCFHVKELESAPIPVTPIQFKCEGTVVVDGIWTRPESSIWDQAKNAIQFVS